ncbi:MAG: hypothetical protein M3332_01620 [Actinomycetota bacterium]|nr:hypothetical protein [Actinomycetota bacterium]
MKITRALRDSCPNGIDCDRIYDTDGDDLVIRGRTIIDPALLRELGLPEHESAVLISRKLFAGI